MSWNEQRRDWVAKKTKEQPQSQDLREPVIGLALLPHIGLLFFFSMPRLYWITSDVHGLKCVGWTYLKVVPLTWKRVLHSLISRHTLYIPPEEPPVIYLSGVDMWWYDWLLAADLDITYLGSLEHKYSSGPGPLAITTIFFLVYAQTTTCTWRVDLTSIVNPPIVAICGVETTIYKF
jgi:hypothetical protein